MAVLSNARHTHLDPGLGTLEPSMAHRLPVGVWGACVWPAALRSGPSPRLAHHCLLPKAGTGKGAPNPAATGPSFPPPARGTQGLPWEAARTDKLGTGPVVTDRQRPPLGLPVGQAQRTVDRHKNTASRFLTQGPSAYTPRTRTSGRQLRAVAGPLLTVSLLHTRIN